MYRNSTTSLIIFLFFIFTTACVSTKEWKNDHFLLQSQEIRGNKSIPTEVFLPFYKQKPNKKFLWVIPEIGIYQFGKKFHRPQRIQNKIDSIESRYTLKIEKFLALQDQTTNIKKYARFENKIKKAVSKKNKKIKRKKNRVENGNWLMRIVGKAPVFIDTLACRQNAQNFHQYYRKKGFLNNKVSYVLENLPKQRAKVVYQIIENTPYRINSIIYDAKFCKDKKIDSLINTALFQKETFVKEKRLFDEDSISAERKRIEIFLRKRGYFFFNQAFVRILADTTLKNEQAQSKQQVDIKFIINDNVVRPHQVFQIEDVFFYTENVTQKNKFNMDTTTSKKLRVNYIHLEKKPRYAYKVIETRLQVYPNKTLNYLDITQTQQLLQTLDMFKFANIPIPDTTKNKATLHIYTNPADKIQLSTEVGANVGQTGIPGPFINFAFKNRNTFKRCEIFESNLQFMIDAQTTFGQGSEFYNSQVISFNSGIRYPTLFFPWLKLFLYNPRTRIGAGYGYVRRPEYTRSNVNASMLYTLQYKLHTINFTISDLNVINTERISADFDSLLNKLPNSQQIRQSFSRSLVSSMYINYTYTHNLPKKPNYSFRILLESGGTTLNLFSNNYLRNNPEFFGLKVFQFLKITSGFNYYKRKILGLTDGLAFRINVGAVRPYRFTETLPFEKFLFAGGSNSVRAWRPFSLGVGTRAVFDSLNNRPGLAPGEILLEGSLEYRFPVYSFVKGALFVDAGNTWNFDRGVNDGTEFKLQSFASQIALGTGFGLRFDFPFVLLRFDFGVKMYDPTVAREERWVIKKFEPNLQSIALNLGIGYPF